ncbi:keratin-associated protein 9-1-like [Drosophila ficusphila]|uniref:keratin-associated protein 9-1-like n=1 Tax=Drosophila ficusphila TaxID=30025 RepID=UPI0007E81E07|nr:keratin-associated protein 9-1-like [Drosophila ficusphila]
MKGAVLPLLLLICVLFVQANKLTDHQKLKKLTSNLVNAIAEANTGKKYGSKWVPPLGKALEEVHKISSRRCFMLQYLVEKVVGLCPIQPVYKPACYPNCAPNPEAKVPPPGIVSPGFINAYPDGSYFPWCYPPGCPSLCNPPYCYPCVAPFCNPQCLPPRCNPPCKPPYCSLPPNCWHPNCPQKCEAPHCIPGNVEDTSTCVPPYCPPPIDCQPPYCPTLFKPTSRTVNMGQCPMRDLASGVMGQFG